ncbi:MAG: HD domain-containing protein [Eubacteriales bacterium]|nr:HD domain-containing protein [Eubacteriales bacterium]MDD4421662.1 HD domain-containing protein [Eubacteriales bacterium]
MDGIFIKREKVDFLVQGDKKDLFLLMEHNNLEIMLQHIDKDSLMWITPTTEEDFIEFFYILKGNLTLVANDEEITLDKNDCFYTRDLKGKVLLKSNTELKILYLATGPVFKYLDDFYGDLNYLIDKITEKDEYTRYHCTRVTEYCLQISQKINMDNINDNLIMASKFHDVGKCFVPDEILLKNGLLNHEEFKEIFKHPTYTKKLLTGRFSKEVVDIAYAHHERMDGSGYPCGLKGEEIPFEARIIAVADSFDAMTTKRPYNNPKTFSEAADELYSLSDTYDITVTRALKDLVDSGELVQNTERG